MTYLKLNIHNFCILYFIQIVATHLWNVYEETIQIRYYSEFKILSYKESALFTGTTLVNSMLRIENSFNKSASSWA